jgi:hypothetical protein
LGGFKDDGFNRVFLEAIFLQEGMVASEVMAGQGGAGICIPDAICSLHFRKGKAG